MPQNQYNASFTVGDLAGGFDVRTSGYGDEVEANATIRPIPYAPTYTVVVQVRGVNAKKRSYRGLLYLESDYRTLASLVGQVGILATPREAAPSPPGTTNAVLTSCKRGDMQNPSTPTGELTVELEFVMTL